MIQASPYAGVDVDITYDMVTNGSFPDVVVLDVRTKSEYDAGHVYGTLWIPVAELESRIDELAGHENHEIIVYCASGGRSATASGILDSYNFTKVYNMLGGISAWQSAGYPVWIATVHNLNTTINYDTIQAAIEAPLTLDGHLISVEEGVYYENVIVTKAVSIIGDNKSITVIDGDHAGTVIHLKCNNTRIEGFTLQNGYYGVLMSPWTHGNVVRENMIVNNGYGIAGHYDVFNVRISWNTIVSNNISGIEMLFSNSIISNNLISDNGKGEFQRYSSGIQISSGVNSQIIYCVNNTISGNTIENHRIGLWAIRYSEENLLIHNNFINNTEQISASASPWNNNVKENYWSNYDGTDLDNDGLGDIPYTIDKSIQDDHPLMGTFSSLITTKDLDVELVSNSTIDSLQYLEENSTITIYVSNKTMNQTTGFCRLTIPHEVLSPPYNVTINNYQVTYTTVFENHTLSIIYFKYSHSTLKIVIIPEDPSTVIALLLMTSTLLTRLVSGRRKAIAKKS